VKAPISLAYDDITLLVNSDETVKVLNTNYNESVTMTKEQFIRLLKCVKGLVAISGRKYRASEQF